jgi:hypothetical protein
VYIFPDVIVHQVDGGIIVNGCIIQKNKHRVPHKWLLPSSGLDHNVETTVALRLGFGWKKEGGHHAPPKFKCRCRSAYDLRGNAAAFGSRSTLRLPLSTW